MVTRRIGSFGDLFCPFYISVSKNGGRLKIAHKHTLIFTPKAPMYMNYNRTLMALIEYCLFRCVCLYGVGCLCSEYDCSIASESPIKWCYISSISIFPQLDSIVVFLPILVCKLVSCTRSPYHVRYMIQQDCCLLQQWRPPAVLCV